LCRTNRELQAVDKEYCMEDEKSCEIRNQIANLFEKGAEEDIELTVDLAKDMERLWNEKAIKKTFKIRSKAHVMDNTPYFFDKVVKIAASNYEANDEDNVRVRYRTLGIVHAVYQTTSQDQKWLVKVTDVGGQRSERRKWIHVFADVNVVIFVMSLNGYDKVVFEDNDKNCWDESFQLFSDVATLKPFKNTDFVVFLNKLDLFTELIKTTPFSVYYKDCPPSEANNPTYVVNYAHSELARRFERSSPETPKDNDSTVPNVEPTDPVRTLHLQSTCATDRVQIETMLKLIQFEAVKNQLRKAAIL